MKLVKLSVFALTMGLFAASCGGAKTEETKTDSTTMATTEAVAPVTPPPADTATKMMADTAKKMEATTTTTETKMETKKK